MPPRNYYLDSRFPSLTLPILKLYAVVSFTTFVISLTTLILQVQQYHQDKTLATSFVILYGQLILIATSSSWYIYHRIIGFVASLLSLVQSGVQILLFCRHRLSELQLLIFNAAVACLWVIVLAIGWSPVKMRMDQDGLHFGVTGWLLRYSTLYSVLSFMGPGVDAWLSLEIGFIVMSALSL